MARLQKVDNLPDRAERLTSKRQRRKEELAGSAIDALKQLGYARTSLRDIAEQSGMSLGVLHYYFEDKVDLINFCVGKYKKEFIAEMDSVLQKSAGPENLARDVARGLGTSIRNDAETHRLWYDIRSQALFDDNFREVVSGIEDALIMLVERFLLRLGLPTTDALPVYLNLDGAFRYYLQRHLTGDTTAVETFCTAVQAQLTALMPEKSN